ncbi:hypothetical protein MVEN_00050100 [Mycena venus]|uniref:DDE Tnp4 domain-containing protein n=1 Tax=Mycena venus TaxID=2733690 RepID=A0A8H6Z6L9_9AGAR|nr:hypothetical protein MVEN_00050100 [Mycena venus]
MRATFFRFTHADVYTLVDALNLPDVIYCEENRICEDKITALCMLLRRLAYPCRLVDLEVEFGWETSRTSRITRLTAEFLWSRWKHLLHFDADRLTPERLAYFAATISAKGSPASGIVAAIDGTLKKIAHPLRNQRIVFNGWYYNPCFWSRCRVEGMMLYTVLQESGLLQILDNHFWGPKGERLFVYGDPAYQTSEHIMALFKGARIIQAERDFNVKMSKIREPVEWMFKEVNTVFKFLNFSDNQKILLLPCGLYYLVAVLLTNAHTILCPSQNSKYFHCDPPSLREYFHGDAIEDVEPDRRCNDAPWGDVDVPLEDESDGDEEDDV